MAGGMLACDGDGRLAGEGSLDGSPPVGTDTDTAAATALEPVGSVRLTPARPPPGSSVHVVLCDSGRCGDGVLVGAEKPPEAPPPVPASGVGAGSTELLAGTPADTLSLPIIGSVSAASAAFFFSATRKRNTRFTSDAKSGDHADCACIRPLAPSVAKHLWRVGASPRSASTWGFAWHFSQKYASHS